MQLQNTNYTLVIRAGLKHNGFEYGKDARAMYAINEMAFHFNQPASDFSYRHIEQDDCIEITVKTDYARISYIISMVKGDKYQAEFNQVKTNKTLCVSWEDIADQFYARGMVYMVTGHCPINDWQYLNKQESVK